MLRSRGVDIDDVERVAGGKTFFWRGEYGWDLNSRETLDTQLGVFEGFAAEAVRRARAPATCCSWPTSSPTCSARCARSCPTRGSSRWTR